MMGRAGPLQRLLSIEWWLRCCDLTRPLLELAVRSVQRGATIDAHGLRSLLELMLVGLVVLVMTIVSLLLVAAPSRPVLLVILAAVTPLAAALLTGSLGTILTLLLVLPLILSFLLLSKQLNLSAVLEVVALGAVDLAVLLVRAPWLVGCRQGPARGAPSNILVGVICLGLLGGAGVVGSLDGKHGLALTLPVAAPTLFHRGGGVFVHRIGFRAGVLAGYFLPSSARAHLSART